MKLHKSILTALSALMLCMLAGCTISIIPGIEVEIYIPEAETQTLPPSAAPSQSVSPDAIPQYSGEPYCVINDNIPAFTDAQRTVNSYETYSPLDDLERCGPAMACIGQDLMPTEDRESISSVKPSGWQSVQYDFVDGKSLYNRCHLIAFQLTGENANEGNLITGTRYMNVAGMLPFENLVADYVKETDNHVLYRVTPHFEGDELVARGAYMEGWSVEDDGEGICFYVYVYNVQPGVTIDYATGSSTLDETYLNSGERQDYVLNTSSRKFHLPECSGASSMKQSNRQEVTATRDLLLAQGYQPCNQCNP